MKTPRIIDFDPDAKTPPLKSSLEKMPAIERRSSVPSRREITTSEPPHANETNVSSRTSVPERSNAPTVQRPNGKRIITRNSFEIYEDQMESLRTLSFHEKMEGKLGSMTGMVREAIDNYLQKRSSGK